MKKILFIIAKDGFRDEEYFVTKEVLKNNFEIITASDGNKNEIALGSLGGEEKIDLNLKEVNINEFDAIIFVGGPGALKHLDNEISYKIIKEASEKNKILAAICISPVILAKAGVLKGKKATVWSSNIDKSAIKILKEYGAEYIDEDVIEDGNIITANGPLAAEKFGRKIKEKLL